MRCFIFKCGLVGIFLPPANWAHTPYNLHVFVVYILQSEYFGSQLPLITMSNVLL